MLHSQALSQGKRKGKLKMGMSASQVRFLSLQHRKHNIGTQLTTLANRKMDLSRDMNRVSKNYTNALNQNVLKWSNDNGISYNKLNYNLMMSPNDVNACVPYIVTDAKSGKVVLNNDTIKNYKGETITYKGQPVTYVDLATMVSTYSGMDKNSECLYRRAVGVYEDGNGVKNGLASIDGAYYIPDATKDYSYQNCLRYEIFEKLGLVTKEQKAKQISLLNALYGSEEAQTTGVYPVGSAWGDYYIALANQKAYSDFLSTKQYLSSGNTFNNTQRQNYSTNYSSSEFQYHAYVDGTTGDDNGLSTITQKLTADDELLGHVDFNSITYMNGGKYVTLETGESGYDAAASAKFNELSGTADKKEFSNVTYKVDVSSSGISYTYAIDDILADGLSNSELDWTTYRPFDGDIDERMSLRLALANYTQTFTGRNGTGVLLLNSDRSATRSPNACKKYLGEICSTLANILKSGQIVSYNDEALNKAVNATVNLFVSQNKTDVECSAYSYSAGESQGKASRWADDRNGYGEFASPWMAWGHDKRENAYVDVQALYDTLISYYLFYSDNAENGVSAANTFLGFPLEFEYNDDGDITNGRSTSSYTYDGQNKPKTCYTTNVFNGKGYQYSRAYFDTNPTGSDSETVYLGKDGDKWYMMDQEHYNSWQGVKCIRQRNAVETYQYVSDNSLAQDFGENNEYKVYGALKTRSGDTYYIINESIKNARCLREDFEIDPDWKEGVDYLVSSYTSDALVDTPTFKIDIKTKMTDSYYGVFNYTNVNVDKDYKNYLENKVQEAKNRISDLENDLENFYSGADQKMMDFYDALFMNIAKNGWIVDDKTSSANRNNEEYLNNKLQNNDFFVTVSEPKVDSTGFNYTTKQAVNVTKIYQVRDEDAENVALAEYEAEKTLISSKERRIDARMQKLETEQEAITTELESVKKVMNDNIDRTFKMFA